MRRIALLLAGILFLGAGCATTGTKYVMNGQELLKNSRDITSSFDRVSYQPLKFGEPVTFSFGENTEVLQQEENRSFVKGFLLPQGMKSYSVRLTSYESGTLNDPAIMYPEVRILDNQYHVVQTLPHTTFVFRQGDSEAGLNAVFFINDNAHGENFLLITSRPMEQADLLVSQSNITSTTTISVPVSGGFVMWFMPTGSNTPPVKMKASPIGKMEIELQEYRPKVVGE